MFYKQVAINGYALHENFYLCRLGIFLHREKPFILFSKFRLHPQVIYGCHFTSTGYDKNYFYTENTMKFGKPDGSFEIGSYIGKQHSKWGLILKIL